MAVDHERACCDQIVEMTAWRNNYEEAAQRWRDQHTAENRESLSRLGGKIDAVELDLKEFMKEMRDAMTYRLPLWATIAFTGMGAALGFLGERAFR